MYQKIKSQSLAFARLEAANADRNFEFDLGWLPAFTGRNPNTLKGMSGNLQTAARLFADSLGWWADRLRLAGCLWLAGVAKHTARALWCYAGYRKIKSQSLAFARLEAANADRNFEFDLGWLPAFTGRNPNTLVGCLLYTSPSPRDRG